MLAVFFLNTFDKNHPSTHNVWWKIVRQHSKVLTKNTKNKGMKWHKSPTSNGGETSQIRPESTKKTFTRNLVSDKRSFLFPMNKTEIGRICLIVETSVIEAHKYVQEEHIPGVCMNTLSEVMHYMYSASPTALTSNPMANSVFETMSVSCQFVWITSFAHDDMYIQWTKFHS